MLRLEDLLLQCSARNITCQRNTASEVSRWIIGKISYIYLSHPHRAKETLWVKVLGSWLAFCILGLHAQSANSLRRGFSNHSPDYLKIVNIWKIKKKIILSPHDVGDIIFILLNICMLGLRAQLPTASKESSPIILLTYSRLLTFER